MISRIIIVSFMIGLVTCGLYDLDNKQPLNNDEFQACQMTCQGKAEKSILYCVYQVSTLTSSSKDQGMVRCFRILEGMVAECIREQCSSQNSDSPNIFRDFLLKK
ncbi:unnamed protein product [Paramecium primaurelia]|uniref:Uncharacterized protein n=1 Tax=Paramecium primaurelia TaxID=5886 RepID=A0A8S1P712_PARPR|nr:unnamed protein product [Paramecium primaurelia]